MLLDQTNDSYTKLVYHNTVGTSGINTSSIDRRNGRWAAFTFTVIASAAVGVTTTVTLQDSSDDSTFAAVSGASTFTLVGSEASAGLIKTYVVDMQKCRRYVRFNLIQDTTGTFATSVSVRQWEDTPLSVQNYPTLSFV